MILSVVVEVVEVAMTEVKVVALTTVAPTTAAVEVEVVNPKLPRRSNLYSLLHIYVQVRT